ncbi:MAG TPA: GFA family protein [Alphaproteobacteria bacterium]|nr:GFA family protein [Alphaproteobacteria bacterium]
MDRFKTSVTGTFEGGCLCGAVRYRIRDPFETGYCHCRQCQRMSGGRAIVWAAVREPDSVLIAGSPLVYRSSDRARRQFCGACGASLFLLYDDAPDVVHVATGTLDEPARVPPAFHVWTSSAIDPLPEDGLPRYPEGLDGRVTE